MRPTPDLPLELWLEILAYLPRTALHKMIGVNRLLFELALDDLYEEIRFIDDDKNMMKTFKQLKHPNIARRARRLFIRPAFLPGMDEDTSNVAKNRLQGFTYVKNAFRKPKHTIAPAELLPAPAHALLEVATKAVKFCTNLTELIIVLHDHALTPSFMTFLTSLLASDSIGPNLRKMSVDTVVVKFPLLLEPLMNCSSVLTNMLKVDLNLSISRFSYTPTDWSNASQALISFFSAFNQSLTSVSLSSSVICDLGTLFESLPRFHKLNSFEFLSTINVQTFTHTEGFSKFIARHASTLEHLTINPHPRQESFNHPDETYFIWLNHDASQKSDRLYTFRQLVLPNLRTLDLELREMHSHWSDQQDRPLLPPLSPIAANLTSLILSRVFLSFVRVSNIIDELPKSSEGILLENLDIYVDSLSPQLFDLFAKELVRLKSLAINYIYTSPTQDMSRHCSREPSFIEVMRARRYLKWSLRTLRLTTSSACNSRHPRSPEMLGFVEECFSKDVVLDMELTCNCDSVRFI